MFNKKNEYLKIFLVFHTEENVPIALVSKLYRDVYRETTVPPIEVKMISFRCT